MERYHDFHIAEEIYPAETAEDDTMLFDFSEDEIRALPQEVVERE
jgi:hypothetical protein